MSGGRDFGLQPRATNPQAARKIAQESNWKKPQKIVEPEVKDFDAFKAAKELNKPAEKFLNKAVNKALAITKGVKLTDEDYTQLGARFRTQPDSMVIQCWAADSIDEGYPLNKEQTKIIMNMHTDVTLGKKICQYIEERQKL